LPGLKGDQGPPGLQVGKWEWSVDICIRSENS
jgi:hypothetical protein